MKRGLSVFLLGFGLATTLFAAAPARATLGEAEDSVATDERSLAATGAATTFSNGYKVQELRSDAVTLREYIAPDGIVFAIAWNGLIHPDLKPLLGAYDTEYQQSLRQTTRKPGRRSLRVKTGQIIVEKWGHMRNLQGRAYVPALIPPGVKVDDIK